MGRSGRGAAWSSGEIELPYMTKAYETKGTILEGSTPGGGPWVQPDVRAGAVASLFQPLSVADLFPQLTTTSSVVRYVSEGTIVNAAAPTSEGALKPEATLPFIQVDVGKTKPER